MNREIKEPTDPKDINREADSTTLEQCGWCKYATGSHRYSYCIEGRCDLDTPYGGRDITWQSVCKFLNASKSEIDSIIDSHKYSNKESRESIKRHDAYIRKLQKLRAKSVFRPPLPQDRHANHFNINDEVVVYFEGRWHFGNVVNGYRHHDGCVSYNLDDNKIKGAGCGYAIPHVMLKKEYDWFKKNPIEYSFWCNRAYKEARSHDNEPIDIAEIK